VKNGFSSGIVTCVSKFSVKLIVSRHTVPVGQLANSSLKGPLGSSPAAVAKQPRFHVILIGRRRVSSCDIGSVFCTQSSPLLVRQDINGKAERRKNIGSAGWNEVTDRILLIQLIVW
jgi:hypothetical protein